MDRLGGAMSICAGRRIIVLPQNKQVRVLLGIKAKQYPHQLEQSLYSADWDEFFNIKDKMTILSVLLANGSVSLDRIMKERKAYGYFSRRRLRSNFDIIACYVYCNGAHLEHVTRDFRTKVNVWEEVTQ